MESSNRNVWIFVAVALAVVLCCCVALIAAGAVAWFQSVPFGWTGGSGVEGAPMEQTFGVGSSPDLQVDTFAGSVTVRAGNEGEIRVVATKHALQSSDLEQIEVEMVEQGDGLLVRARNPRRLNNAWVQFEIVAPAGTRLDAHTGSGRMNASGFDGGVKLDTGSGSITVGDLQGEVDLHTGTGTIEARNVGGRLKADTGSGRLTLEGVTGSIDAHTGSGGIEVFGAQGPGRFDTGSGSIDYQGAPQGECRFRTGSGSIGLRLPADLDATVDLHTGSGSVDVAYEVDGQISRQDVQGIIGSGDVATIYAHTGSGSIDLTRQ
jgi:hypothetical protein